MNEEKKPRKLRPTAENPLVGVRENIIIQPPHRLEKVGNIVVAESAAQKSFYGRVVAAGPQCEQVEVGDLVIYLKDGGEPLDMESLGKRLPKGAETPVVVTEDMVAGITTEDYGRRVLGMRVDDIKPIEVVMAEMEDGEPVQDPQPV